ncbi:VanW family protein [Ectobacillus antri]|jgi:vancomycin resistance protein YoaR|uniref:VanW family protein n=1 Tax=Ectobacillus antri TaxID=2486280 RepID=A0ABT6H5I0_9BACI|nr:VanW family protein [Ectobacillus antri]MDG4657390.1 VanW family protein [Ectobacillus antri]MDG5754479.1 VanW family protein [Ectobacillus antri]
MKMRNWIIGSVIAGGVGLCVAGGVAYSYTSKLNQQLDTYVLPHTSFEGISLDGKTKKEVEEIVQQKVDQLNQQTISYTLNGVTETYTWKDLGVQYKGTDVAKQVFEEQQGNLKERYNFRKKAENNELNRSYKLEAKLDSQKYEAFIKDKYNNLLSKPKNASIAINGTAITITESKDGSQVDKNQLKALTEQSIATANTQIQVPIMAVRPERTTEDVKNMGITEVIAEYRTPMNGRNASQTFNVQRAASTLTGAFVAPDEVFSFNGRVGITDAKNGYQSAAVFINGKIEQSAGGGVCQVSSTLYGAVLRADLAVVERSNHSLPVGYIPLGQDAAVADYGPDLKFKNNTGKHIYIQSFVENNQAVARIFGTSTGKNVQVSSKVISDTDKAVVVDTYKTVTLNGKVLQSGRISKSTYKKPEKAGA